MRFPALALAGLSLSIGSCARAASEEPEREVIYRAESVVTVRIVNRSQLDAVIYLAHDGTQDRLGLAGAASTSSFSVRTRTFASGLFNLVADPVGQRRVTRSETLSPSQGSTFTWTLESDFSRGSLIVQE